MRACWLLSVSLSMAGCQGYEFDPVEAKALGSRSRVHDVVGEQKPPKIMLVLDRSGSMKSRTADDASLGCCATVSGTTCSGYDPVGECKWNTLKSLLVGPGQFLDATRGMARHGLAIFPDSPADGSNACVPGRIVVGVEGGAGATVDAIEAALQAATPAGGTPTASTLQALLSDTAFLAAEPATRRYALLVTDGLPNCNPRLDAQTCACTGASCGGDPKNCVDEAQMVANVRALRTAGVETFVIGFGSAFENPVARRVLDAAAVAGGQPQAGPTRFFQAGSRADLESILRRVQGVLQSCTFALGHEVGDPRLVEVRLEDRESESQTVLARGADWTFPCDAQSDACGPGAACPGDGLCWTYGGRCQDRCVDSRAEVEIVDPVCAGLKTAAPDRFRLRLLSVEEL